MKQWRIRKMADVLPPALGTLVMKPKRPVVDVVNLGDEATPRGRRLYAGLGGQPS